MGSNLENSTYSVSTIITELKEMDTYYEQIKFLDNMGIDKRKNLFENEKFVRYFLRFLELKNHESNIWEAINLIPSGRRRNLSEQAKEIILSESQIICSFSQLCLQAESNDNNKILIHTIRLLRNLGQFSLEFAIPIFNMLKMNPKDKELKEACMNYCEFTEGRWGGHGVIHDEIVSYVTNEIRNINLCFQRKI